MNRKLTIKDWLFVTRPWSFSVSGLPAFVAMMYVIYAHSHYNWMLGILAVIGAIVFHAAGNMLSDYHDYKKGVDQLGKQGGTDTLTSGLFTTKQILTYALSLLVIGIMLGLYLVWQSGIELLWIGLIGTIGTIFYSFFKYRALGDLVILIVYGPTIMLGTGFVMLGYIEWKLFFISLPMAFITVNVLHANNTRDQKGDSQAGTKTIAMKIGTKVSIYYYYLLTILSYASVAIMVAINILPLTALLSFLTIPIAYKNCMMMKNITDTDVTSINNLDEATAKLQLVFSLLMSLALIIACVI